MKSARKNAEELMNRVQARDSEFKLEQQQRSDALAAKTKRLRDLRLAKEAADKEAEAASPPAKPGTSKPKRSRQT